MYVLKSLLTISNALPVLVAATFIFALTRMKKQPLWAEAFRRIGRNKLAIVSLVVIAIYALIALTDSFAWQDNKDKPPVSLLMRVFAAAHVQRERTYSAPFAHYTTGEPHPHKLKGWHLLGTDGAGFDVLMQTLRGCHTAMIIGGFTSFLITPLALLFGMSAGYYGKLPDDIIQYIFTVVASVPSILLQIALLLVLGPGVINICIALGLTGWVGLCRLVRGETLKHRDREYVRAAKALGASNTRILTRHILPNLLPVVIISITLGFSGLVLSETILSYLGIGVPAGTGSWGNMIDGARLELARDPVIWWNLTSASMALFILVLALNFFGDALRDAIDPRLRSN